MSRSLGGIYISIRWPLRAGGKIQKMIRNSEILLVAFIFHDIPTWY